MIAFLEQSSGSVLGVKATGKLTHADYQQFIPRLEALIREHGKIRVLFELEDCQGWEVGAAWDDLKFGLKHRGDVERCAVVGDKKWQEWMTKLSRLFFNVRYFDKAELEQAWRWVLEGAPRRSEAVKSNGPVLGIVSGLTNCQHS
jgi:SpoIIAA-like